MKKLSTLLLFTFALWANAQNYELFPDPSDTLSFQGESKVVSFISFDSVISNGSTKTYWPHQATDLSSSRSNNSVCVGHIEDTAWFGYQIVDHGDSSYTFKHFDFEFTIDLNSRSLIPDSIGWVKFYKTVHTLYANFNTHTTQTIFDNSRDAVLTFDISFGNFTTQMLEVSKSNGLVTFPFIVDNYAYAPWGMIGNTLKRITNYPFIKRADIFSFQVGDVFHYYENFGNVGPNSPWQSGPINDSVFGKTFINADSVVYEIRRETGVPHFNTQTQQAEMLVIVDTLVRGYGRLNEPMSKKLTFQSDTVSGYKTSFWLKDTLGQNGVTFIENVTNRTGNCLNFLATTIRTYSTFVTGVGLVSATEVDSIDITKMNLVYYKKANGQTWGTPYHLGSKKLALQKPLKIYPNPASDVLNIELPEGLQQMKIVVIDQLGRVLLSEVITSENQYITVEHLAPGTYFIKSGNGSAVPFVKR